MNNIFSNISFCRVVSMVLAVVFLTSFPASSTSLTLCVDVQRNHIVDQEHLHLSGCHSTQAGQTLINVNSIALLDQESKDCIDISLSSPDPLNRPTERIVPDFAKFAFSFLFIDSHMGFRNNFSGKLFSVLNQTQRSSNSISALRTVVLLI